MPQKAWSDKRERQYEHIKESQKDQGRSEDRAEEIAARAEPAAEQICKLCGYLPLALRAAGSLLAITADQDPVDYATQLQDERSRLELIGTADKQVILRVNSKPADDGAREITVVPTADESPLYYRAWVQKNVDEVAKKTNGSSMLRDSGSGENLRPLCSAHFFRTCRLNDSGIAVLALLLTPTTGTASRPTPAPAGHCATGI